MRKLFALVCCLFTISAFASEWGVLSGFVQQAHATDSKEIKYPYLIFPILQGKPLRIYFSKLQEGEDEALTQDLAATLTHSPKPAHGMPQLNKNSFQKLITQAYTTWFTYTAKTIRLAERENEFADILPLLDRGIQVEFVDDLAQADIRVIITKDLQTLRKYCGGRNTHGCYQRTPDNSGQPVLFLSTTILPLLNSFSKTVTLHEVGHSLGLSDQYTTFRPGGRANSDTVYSTPESSSSIMNRTRTLTCDDADAIINLLDLARGEFHGGATGWKSFCKNPGDRYIQGIPASKGPYFIDMAGDGYPFGTVNLTTVSTQPDTWQQEVKQLELSYIENYSPFNEPTFTVDQRDAQGRPLHATAEGGLEAFYMYHYEMTWRIVTHGDLLLMSDCKRYFYTLDLKHFKKRKRLASRSIIFAGNYDAAAIFIEQDFENPPWRRVAYFEHWNEDNKEFTKYGFVKVHDNVIDQSMSEVPFHTKQAIAMLEDQLVSELQFGIRSDTSSKWTTLRGQLAKLGSED